jgi:pantothenate synthetase
LNEEEQALKALTISSYSGDANGYLSAKQQAIKALKKMEEPMTKAEIQDLIESTRQMMNKSEPNTVDNVEARQKADQEYQEAIAKAAEKLNAAYAKTGINPVNYGNR